ncbi:MAG: rhomboid family intramembrane serine protease [Planctomycetes bacterium]|nr:rhomboid family intramembrane serine protease [Planctomycetota bacterium]MBI3847633.1 rhomboid family intramembrane serine protease [Planctomycetota bacterium]
MDRVVHHGVDIDSCHWCGGVFLDAGELQKITGEVPREWAPASALRRHPKSVACPACQHRLVEREYGRGSRAYLDHCDTCGGVFLDSDHVRLIRFRSREYERHVEGTVGESPVRVFLAYIAGIPMEISNPRNRQPFVVYSLIALNVAAFLLELAQGPNSRQFIHQYALIPNLCFEPQQWYRFLTAMFLHAGFFHIAFNLYFLWVFGDDVEDQFGHVSFLLLYLVWGIVAGIVDAAIMHTSSIPRVGASGAIAGVLGAYVVLRPRAQLFVAVFFIPMRIGAAIYLLGWAVLQLLSAALGVHGIAWWAHIGGFVAGLLTAAWARRRHVVEMLPN